MIFHQLAGLHEEFGRAVGWIERKLDVQKAHNVSTFETTIRVLGGLLSGWIVSDGAHPVLLEKVRASRLPVFIHSFIRVLLAI